MTFKIGDRVEAVSTNVGVVKGIPLGLQGTVIYMDTCVLVQFDEPIPGGHAGGGDTGKSGHCLWYGMDDDGIRLLTPYERVPNCVDFYSLIGG